MAVESTRPIPVFLLIDSDDRAGEAKALRVGRFALRVLDARRSHAWVEHLPRREAPPRRRRPLWRCATDLCEQDAITGEITRSAGVLWPGAAPVACATDDGGRVRIGSRVTVVFVTRYGPTWELRVIRTPPIERLWSLPRLVDGAPLETSARWIDLARRLEMRWSAR